MPLFNDGDSDEDAERQLEDLHRRLWSRNPYEVRDAVTGQDFFGRRRLLQALHGHQMRNEASGLFGLRKSGKTSILKEFIRLENNADRLDSDEVVLVYHDLEYLPGIAGGDPIGELIPDLAERVRVGLAAKKLRTQEVAGLPVGATVQEFSRALTRLLGRLKDTRLVLILDEIEHLCPPGAAITGGTTLNQKVPELFGVFRRLMQEHSDTFALIIAGLASASIESGELYGRSNPLFSWAHGHYVGPFDLSETTDLLRALGERAGLDWTDEAVRSAFTQTGGHPLLLRNLGSSVLKASHGETRTAVKIVRKRDVNNILAEWRGGVAGQLTEIINHVDRYYPDESTLIHLLMVEPTSFVELAAEYPAEMRRLRDLGVVSESEGRWVPSRVLELGWPLFHRSERRTTQGATAKGVTGAGLAISDLLKQGEGQYVEFKNSARVSKRGGASETDLVSEVVKTCLAFMNAYGGTLLIGVSDDGNVVGVKADVARSQNSEDRYVLWLTSQLKSYVGDAAAQLANMALQDVDGQTVMRVDVDAASAPCFLQKATERHERGAFLVRNNAQSDLLIGDDVLKYVRHRWPVT